ncbi:MAG: radical SAM protein [Planctomycetota bacterium]
MDIEIRDTTMASILLLEPCNFDCPHCLRSDEPMERGYRLTFDQLERFLFDCRTLETVELVHFSGGEPTLWREGDRDLVDVLLAVADAGFTPWFTTNGSAWIDPEACRTFLRRYLAGTERDLIVTVSVDTFHDNFDRESGRADCLDGLAAAIAGLPETDVTRLEIRIAATTSTDPDSHLPEEMVEHYEGLGMAFRFGPLVAMGRAREEMADLCPEPDAVDRATAHWLVLIGEDYYLPLVGGTDAERDWPRAGSLGRLPENVVRAHRSGA